MFWIWKRFLFFNLTGILATCGSWKLWNSIKWRYMCSKTNNDNFWLSVDCYWLKLVCELFHWWKGRNLIIFIISLDFIITIIFNVIFFISLCIVDISIRKVTRCNLLFELNDLTAFLDLVMGSILTNRQLGNQKFEIQMNNKHTHRPVKSTSRNFTFIGRCIWELWDNSNEFFLKAKCLL